MLFNEPKLLKWSNQVVVLVILAQVSVLFNEPKLLKYRSQRRSTLLQFVSVLFNEPKLLKSLLMRFTRFIRIGFSALQRAEIAEIAAIREAPTVQPVFQCSSTSRNC